MTLRKRNIKKQVWLNQGEEKKLKDKSKQSGLCESELIRRMINNCVIKEKPDDRFYDYIKELRAIGVNLNQIARKCNAIGIVDNIYMEEAKKLNNFMLEVKEKFLL